MDADPSSSKTEKCALVTGAAGIVGPGICRELKEAGWKVAAADYDAESFARYERMRGKRVEADLLLTADLSQRSNCLRLVEEVREKLGPIGLLVNNATGYSRNAPLAAIEESDCQSIIGVDLLAPLYLTQAATEDLARFEGLVVNISSVRAQNLAIGGLLYVVAKTAIEKMTEALALELGPRRVRVNTLRLGQIPGEGFLRGAAELLPPSLVGEFCDDLLARHMKASAVNTLTGQCGSPLDIGKMIVYLASPIGHFINAAVIPIDGGFTLVRQQKAATAPSPLTYLQQWMNHPREELEKWLKEKGINYEIGSNSVS